MPGLDEILQQDALNTIAELKKNTKDVAEAKGRIATLEATQTSGVINAGDYNAATNTPTLSASSAGFNEKGQYYVAVKGKAAFAGKNFAQNEDLAVGDYLIPYEGGWQRRKPSDAALEVALTVQQTLNELPLNTYENLITYSEELTAAVWIRTGIASAVLSAGPDGLTQDAFFITEAANGTFHQLTSANITVTQGLPYFQAIYVQGAARKKCSLRAGGQAQFGGTVPSIMFDTQTGQISSPSSSVTASGVNRLGNGWYRIWLVATPTQTGLSNLTFYLANDSGQISYAGDGVSGLRVARPQIGQSGTPQLYAKTGASTLIKTPQTTLTAAEKASFAAKQPPQTTLAGYGILDAYNKTQVDTLLETVGTFENLLRYSGNPSVSPWVRTGIAVTLSDISGPDGQAKDAYLLTEDSTNGGHVITSGNEIVTKDLPHTFFCYIKKDTRDTVRLRAGGAAQFSTQPGITFNASSGQLSNPSSSVTGSGVKNVGAAWFLVFFTAIPIQTGLSNIAVALANETGLTSYQGDGVSRLYIARFQLTQTVAPVHYTPTTVNPQPKVQSVAVTEEKAQEWDKKASIQDIKNAIPLVAENLIAYSEDLTVSAWAKSNLTSAFSTTQLGPDGVSKNAIYLKESADAANTSHQITSPNISVTKDLPFTFACFVKKGTRANLRLRAGGLAQFGTQPSISFNADTGAVTNISSTVNKYSAENVGDGWWLVGLTATPIQTGASNINLILTNSSDAGGYIGDGSSGLFVSSFSIVQNPAIGKYFKTTVQGLAKSAISYLTDAEKELLGKKADGSQVPVFFEQTDRLLVPPVLYLVDGLELPVYQSSIISDYTINLDSFRTVLVEKDEAARLSPRYTYFRDVVYLKAENLRASVALALTRGGNYRTYLRSVAINRVAQGALAGKSVKVNMWGDSITHQGMATAVVTVLSRLGVTMTSIGTNTEVPNYGNVPPLKIEGHYSWRYKNFIGKSNLASGNVITPSLGSPGQWKNPLQKLATADDKSSFPALCFRSTGKENELSYAEDTDKTGDFYIVDVAYYLSVHSLATPDVITIALSTNDITLDGAAGVSNALFALEQLIRRIKAALPAVKIVIIPAPVRGKTASVDNTFMVNTYDWIEKSMVLVKTLQATLPGLYLLGVWAHINRDFNFPFTDQGALNAQNETRILTVSDATHPGISGIYEYGTAIASCVANLI